MRAVALGFELQCPLPFDSEEYVEDFASEDSRRNFANLLARATAILELDGTRAQPGQAYLAAGRVVLDQSDVLLAIWNGEEARGPGGTGQIIAEAETHGIPTIVIDASAPHAVRIAARSGKDGREPSLHWRDYLRSSVHSAILPPGMHAVAAQSEQPWRYFAEAPPRLPWYGRLHALLERLLTIRSGISNPHSADGSPETAVASGTDFMLPTPALVGERHFRWADDLAVVYASLHRSSVTLRYVLILPAILGACIGFYIDFPLAKLVGFSIQAASLAAIFLVYFLNRQKEWHARFIDYRLLAELLRHQIYLGDLGRSLPIRLPALRRDTLAGWVLWHVRAVTRDSGLPTDRMTAERLGQLRDLVRKELEVQRSFHGRTGDRYTVLSNRLDAIVVSLYAAGLAAVLTRAGFFVFTSFWEGAAVYESAINATALIIPALTPIFLGLRSQGEYPQLATQYRATRDLLDALADRLGVTLPSHEDLSRLAVEAAEVMSTEVSGWRTTVKARTLSYT
jgi:hypothetical protein